MAKKGKPNRILTAAEVRSLRARYQHRYVGAYNGKPKVTQIQLAKELGITQASVSNMLSGKTYRHVK